MPPARREMGVHAGQSRPNRPSIHNHELLHLAGEVEGETMSDVGAAVVPGNGVHVMAKLPYQLGDSCSHSPL
jgi:hypothetical protein